MSNYLPIGFTLIGNGGDAQFQAFLPVGVLKNTLKLGPIGIGQDFYEELRASWLFSYPRVGHRLYLPDTSTKERLKDISIHRKLKSLHADEQNDE